MILDTSVWIAYLNIDDSQHAKARTLFASLKPNTVIIIPEYIYLEIVTILALRMSKVFSINFMNAVSNNSGIRLLPTDPDFFEKVIEVFRKIRSKQISFADASLVYLSTKYPVITFDKQLQKELKK